MKYGNTTSGAAAMRTLATTGWADAGWADAAWVDVFWVGGVAGVVMSILLGGGRVRRPS